MVEFEGVFQLKFSHLTGDYFIYANGSSLFLIGSLDFAVQIYNKVKALSLSL